jgi:hypothetical protein
VTLLQQLVVEEVVVQVIQLETQVVQVEEEGSPMLAVLIQVHPEQPVKETQEELVMLSHPELMVLELVVEADLVESVVMHQQALQLF